MAVGWAAKDTSTQLTAITTVQYFDDTPTLDANEYAHVQVVGNSDGTTDSLQVSVYSTLDPSGENWDTVPVYSFVLDCTSGADNDVSFIVRDVYKFRVGVVRVGSTDTFVADMGYRIATMS